MLHPPQPGPGWNGVEKTAVPYGLVAVGAVQDTGLSPPITTGWVEALSSRKMSARGIVLAFTVKEMSPGEPSFPTKMSTFGEPRPKAMVDEPSAAAALMAGVAPEVTACGVPVRLVRRTTATFEPLWKA